jgi:hypothetical protein
VPVLAVSVPDAAPEPDAPKEAVRFRIDVPNNALNLELCVSVAGRSYPRRVNHHAAMRLFRRGATCLKLAGEGEARSVGSGAGAGGG